MRTATNRFSLIGIAGMRAVRGLGLAALLGLVSPARAQIRSTLYSRTGTWPAIITTRGAVEQLTRDVYGLASALAPGDSIIRFGVQLWVGATDTRGHTVSVDRDSPSALDSLARLLDRRAELSAFRATVYDMRWYRADTTFVTAPHLRDLSFSFTSGAENPTHTAYVGYTVWGRDRARVDAIADRIDAFGRASSTWRTPKNGEIIRTTLKVLGLILIPLALGLRDRRFAWTLYPTSLLVFAASYLIPFASLFTACRILGSS
jgi:hypothetical protein